MGGGGGGGFGLEVSLQLPGFAATRVRGAVEVALEVNKVDPDLGEGEFILRVDDAWIPISPGLNSVAFDVPFAPLFGDLFRPQFEVLALNQDNLESAWASIELQQCELLVQQFSTVSTVPLVMAPVAIQGVSNGGSGGFNIEPVGDLASVTDIQVVGYFAADATPLLGVSELSVSRWLDGEYIEVDPAVSLPLFDEPSGHEGAWGWFSSDPLFGTIPAGVRLCKVSLDGGEPVLAVLPNGSGY